MDLRGMPEVQKMLAEVDGAKLNNRTRRALRAGVKPIREELRRRGSAPGFPRKFRSTRTRAHRNPLGVSVSPTSPLSSIFEHGAAVHEVAPRHGRALANEAVGFFAQGAVSHPGMRARPLVVPAFNAAEPAAERAFTAVLFDQL